MQQRTLGQQGLTVSAIGYGAMGITSFYGASDEQRSLDAVRRAHELGVTFFDTAELYGWGEGEKVLGRAVHGFRDEVVLATKFGFSQQRGKDSRPEHIRQVLDNSLGYLGVDHIDVLYQHRVDPNVPIEDVAGTVKEAIEAGKVKYFGLSEAGPETLRRAHAVQPVSVLQTEYSVFARDVEQLFPVLDELGVGLVPYSPLARGFLSGAVQSSEQYGEADLRANGARAFPWWQPGNFEKNVEIVDALGAIAADKGVTLSQLALAWVLARGEHIVPIPGSRDPERVAQNIAAVDVELSLDELTAIDAAVGDGPYGERNSEGITWQ